MTYPYWEERALPMLALVAKREGQPAVSIGALAAAAGLEDPEIAYAEVLRLHGAYIEGRLENMGGNRARWMILDPHLTPRGAQAIGVYPPDDAYAALVSAIESRIEAETDEPTKSRLRTLLGVVKDLGTNVVGGIVIELLKHGVLPT